MDLSKLSDDDLIALQSGNLSAVSDDGLNYLAAQKKTQTQPMPAQEPPKQGMLDKFTDYAIGNTLGAVRGAADIGNTLINAGTYIPRKLAQIPADRMGIENPLEKWNQQREAGLESWTQDNQDRPGFGIGRVGGNVLGTLGVPAALGGFVQGISQAPRALQLAQALKTGGLGANAGGIGTRVAGGALTGGATAGLINPDNAGTGAMIGGALPVATKLAGALGRGVGGMVEPFYQRGRERIIGRAINAVAGNQADDALRNLQQSKPLVQGSQPTAGMAAQNPGIAALERASVANSPIATNELALRQAANNEARISALRGISGSDDALNALKESRDLAADTAYGTAKKADAMRRSMAIDEAMLRNDNNIGLGSLANLPVKSEARVVSDSIRPTQTLINLSKRPSFQSYIEQAKKLAADKGMDIGNPLTSIDGLHYIKLAIDDALQGTPTSSLAKNAKSAAMDMKNILLKEMDEISPVYGAAREAYKQASIPVNQMEIGQEIYKKSINRLTENIRPSSYAAALSDETAQRVTGNPNASLEKIMTPEQLSTLNNIKQDLLNQNFAQTAGRGVGSNTVQNLAYSNILDQFGVPTAMREFAPAGAVGNILGQAGRIGYKSANERLAQELAEALLNPQSAAQVMLKAREGAISPEVLQLLQSGLRTAPVISAQ